MILFEEEKSKLLLGGMPYLRPLYIKGILSMYEILSISWNESLIDLTEEVYIKQLNEFFGLLVSKWKNIDKLDLCEEFIKE